MFPARSVGAKGGTRTPCLAASDPKSGASTNSATFAESRQWSTFAEKSTYYTCRGGAPLRKLPGRVAAPARILRSPVEVIYRFARSADDLADEGSDPPDIRLEKLNSYRAALSRDRAGRAATRSAVSRSRKPSFGLTGSRCGLFRDLLDAFRQDVTQKALRQLRRAFRLLPPLGEPGGTPAPASCSNERPSQDLAASDAICSALQLINFWQDVDIDYSRDRRIYLPQDEMARHGVTEAHLAERRCDAAGARCSGSRSSARAR